MSRRRQDTRGKEGGAVGGRGRTGSCWNDPSGHGSHDDEFSAAANVPASHVVQLFAAGAEKLPVAHAEQARVPVGLGFRVYPRSSAGRTSPPPVVDRSTNPRRVRGGCQVRNETRAGIPDGCDAFVPPVSAGGQGEVSAIDAARLGGGGAVREQQETRDACGHPRGVQHSRAMHPRRHGTTSPHKTLTRRSQAGDRGLPGSSAKKNSTARFTRNNPRRFKGPKTCVVHRVGRHTWFQREKPGTARFTRNDPRGTRPPRRTQHHTCRERI